MINPLKLETFCAQTKIESNAPGVMLLIFHNPGVQLVFAADPAFQPAEVIARLRSIVRQLEENGMGQAKIAPAITFQDSPHPHQN